MEELFKVAVCDDEKIVLDEQCEMLSKTLSAKNLNYSLSVFESPVELMGSEECFDLVILDVEMGDINGIKVAEKLKSRNEDCAIFFVTNYETYMDDALNKHALRFWTKPINPTRLSYGIDSVLNEIDKRKQFIIATKGSDEIKIMMKNIIYIYVVAKKVYIVTTKGEIAVNNTFESIRKQLDKSEDFFETHRGYCVNFKYVKRYEKDKVHCSHEGVYYEVYLSRRKQSAFGRSFTDWMVKGI